MSAVPVMYDTPMTAPPAAGETGVRRARAAARAASDASRRQAAAALQRALDRRDNGGAAGH
jgi:hypothetical protein